ncbi:MAG: NDP-sugar synthase [Candidatus Baltobacteraceae bacterium]|jgi:NDP-sugar pyrophosphorylase family protein
MILAGGMSTRLYPLTKAVPKPLVPVAGEPNTAHVIRYLRSFGIEDVAINVYYHAEQVIERFGDGSSYGVNLTYLHEDRLTGSAGAVKGMEAYLSGETFVVVGCDDLTDLRLDTLVEFHRKKGALATIALVHADDVTQYGVVVLDDDGRIVEFQEKPARGTEKSNLVNTGIYVFEPEILARIPPRTFWDFGRNVFPELQQARAAFYGLEMQAAYWTDIGTPAEYRRATNDVLAGRVRLLGAARPRGIPPDTIFGDDVHIEGDVRIGERARLGAGVRIVGPSVVGDDVAIGPYAVVESSILWDGARVGAYASVSDCIVGSGFTVAPGAALRGAIVANEPEPEPAAR